MRYPAPPEEVTPEDMTPEFIRNLNNGKVNMNRVRSYDELDRLLQDADEDALPEVSTMHEAGCSVSTSSSVCTIAPLGTLSSHRTFSLYVHSPANISRCLSLFSSFLFWSSQSTFQEARLRDPKHYIGDEDSDNFFFFLVVVGTS